MALYHDAEMVKNVVDVRWVRVVRAPPRVAANAAERIGFKEVDPCWDCFTDTAEISVV